MAVKTKKQSTTLRSTWDLENELNNLPEGEFRRTILAWKQAQQVSPGAMSISGITYRSNLQYLLENQDKRGIIDEMKNHMKQSQPAPKEHGQDILKYGPEFKTIFGIQVTHFANVLGFDVIKFDEWLGTPDGISTADYLTQRYGDRARQLVESLL